MRFSISAQDAFLGKAISHNMFGSAFENRGQSVEEGAPFHTVADLLDLDVLRFPGGSQTENYFDPANPENERPPPFISTGGAARFTKVSDFLSYTAEHAIESIFVLPTWRYFDRDAPENGYTTDNMEADIRYFVEGLLDGEWGQASITAFEIGNEWFNSRIVYTEENPNGWMVAEFASVQNRMIELVSDIFTERVIDDIGIWAQTSQLGGADFDKNGIRDNVEILSALSDKSRAAITGVIDHFYQPTRYEHPLDEGYFSETWVPENRADRLKADGWNFKDNLDFVVTEWNVRDADHQLITGFERIPMFLRLFAEMSSVGVTHANVYTVQALGLERGYGSLSQKDEYGLTPTGMLFSMMKESLVGTRLVDENRDGKLDRNDMVFQDEAGNDAGFTFSYRGAGKHVIYYSSAVEHEVDISLSGLQDYLDAGYLVDVTRLSPEEGDPTRIDIDGVMHKSERIDVGDRLDLTLGGYDLIEIKIYNPNFVPGEDDQFNPEWPTDGLEQGRDEDDDEEEGDQRPNGAGGACFVATAAYGDRLHPDVVMLRHFRDRTLVRYRLGRGFIRLYWRVGPRLAAITTPASPHGRVFRFGLSILAAIMRISYRRADSRE